MRLKEFKAELNPKSGRHNFTVHKNVLNKLLVGNFSSDIKNRGLEFVDYRAYTQNDDSSRIDWRASLKSNELLVRQTIEEKAVNVLFMVDVSDTMLFSTGDKLKCEYAAEIVSALSFAIQHEGNAIGLCMYNSRLVKKLSPKIGVGQYVEMMKELANPKNYGGKSNLSSTIKQALGVLKMPALVIIISDFLDTSEGWENYLKVISLRYELIGLVVRDPKERKLPTDLGYFMLQDASSNKKMLVDTKEFEKKYEADMRNNEEYISSCFKKAKATSLVIQIDEDYFKPVINFLEKRSRIKRQG